MRKKTLSPRWISLRGALCLWYLLLALCLPGCGTRRERDVSGEMVLYGQTSRVRGFDPVKAGDVASAQAISKIYEGLIQYSYLARPYRVEPQLAESLPVVTKDGCTYTFRIRKGIYFQDDPCFTDAVSKSQVGFSRSTMEPGRPRVGDRPDGRTAPEDTRKSVSVRGESNPTGKGRELTAADFVYSIKRVADLKNQSTGYWAFNDRVVGLDEFREASGGEQPTDYDREVAGLRATDRYVFQIVLKRPYPQLVWILTMQYAFAVPREAVEFYGEAFVNHPVGTGPYTLASYRQNYRLEFARSPVWRRTGRIERYPAEGETGDVELGLLEDAGRPIPFVDRIVQYVIDDSSTQWLKFVTGEMESSGISRDNWDAVIAKDKGLTEALGNKGIRMFTTPTLDVYYIGFNMDDPVVGKNRKLRQALSCAFNTDEWIRFYNGRVVRARGPIPPGVSGYEDKPSPYGFDTDKAKRLLAEAGFPGGVETATGKRLKLTMELGSASDPDVRESVELLVDFFARIGVTLNPSYNNWPTFLSKMERRQCQMYSLGWVADYPDAENFLQLFYGPNSSPGPNHSNYANTEFDRLYEEIRVMSDGPERTERYRKMADMVVEDSPWLFTHHPMAYGLHHRWLQNYKPHDFPYGMVKYQKIDSESRREWKATFGKEYWKK